jgi:hypothetical protein
MKLQEALPGPDSAAWRRSCSFVPKNRNDTTRKQVYPVLLVPSRPAARDATRPAGPAVRAEVGALWAPAGLTRYSFASRQSSR